MTCHHVLPCQCHVLLYRIVICKLHSSQSPSVCLYSEADLDQDKKLRFRSSLSVSSPRGFFNLITASTSRSRGSIMAMSPPRSDHVIMADMRGGCIARSYSLDIAMISNCWPSWGPIRIVILSVIQPGSSIIIPCHCVRCQQEQLSWMMISYRQLTLALSIWQHLTLYVQQVANLLHVIMLSRKGASSKTWYHEDDSSSPRHLLCGDQWLPHRSLSLSLAVVTIWRWQCWCWPYDGQWSRHNCVSPLWSAFPHKPHDQERVLPGF